MVTGRRAYDEEHRRELSPPLLESVVSRALAKSPAERWRSVRDIEILLGLLPAPEAFVPKAEPRSRVSHFVWASLVVLAGLTAWWVRPVPRTGVTRLAVSLPEGEPLSRASSPAFAISPDGRRVVFVSHAANEATTKLFVRDLDSFGAQLIPGAGGHWPIFSPDGESVAFVDELYRSIHSVSRNGGTVAKVCELAASPRGLTWTESGEILFGSDGAGLWHVPASGGIPEPLTTLASGETFHGDPTVLPGSRGLLFSVGRSADVQVALLPRGAKEHRVLLEGVGAAYVSSGHLVFGRAGSAALFAAPFDLDSLEIQGQPFQLEDTLAMTGNGQPQFRIGVDGALVYAPEHDSGSAVVWVERGGATEIAANSDRGYHTVQLSPDGKRFVADEITGGIGSRIWVHDLDRGTRVLAVSGSALDCPRFKPDGTVIAYQAGGDISAKAADGTGEALLLVKREREQREPSWSRDGTLLAFTDFHPDTRWDLWILSPDGLPHPFLVTPASERAPTFSPNGKWIAYQSDASGRKEIYVQPFPGPGIRYLVSTNGGKEPVWSHDGRELFYRENTAVMAVSVEVGDSFRAGAPNLLFDGPYQADPTGHASYDVSPDGQRFLMIRNPDVGLTELRVVLNFPEELKALAALER
jgi:serine/threonine-protein kinase